MHLVLPSVQYKQSFLTADKATLAVDGRHLFSRTVFNPDNFEDFCHTLNSYAATALLPDDKVHESYFWLIDNDMVIGRISIRHRLNEDLLLYSGHIGYIIAPPYRNKGYGTAILKLGLLEAKKMNLEKVLVTCDHTNTGSAKIIERNGGILENEIEVPGKHIRKKRYWINISD